MLAVLYTSFINYRYLPRGSVLRNGIYYKTKAVKRRRFLHCAAYGNSFYFFSKL
jgi:hypothetical protein